MGTNSQMSDIAAVAAFDVRSEYTDSCFYKHIMKEYAGVNIGGIEVLSIDTNVNVLAMYPLKCFGFEQESGRFASRGIVARPDRQYLRQHKETL